MDPRHLVLVFVQNPAYYPHVERHALAARSRFARVTVLAVFEANDALPPMSGVTVVPIVRRLPRGIEGFCFFMVKTWFWLVRNAWDICEAVDPPCLFPAALARFPGRRLFYFSMELFQHTPALARKPAKRLLWKILERVGIWKADAVATVNQSVADSLRRIYGLRICAVVRSTPWRLSPRYSSGDLRRLCGIAPGDPVVIYQGALEPGRGIEFVCDALLDNSQIHFVILGKGELEPWIRARIREQANVHYGGSHPFARLMELAADADVGLVWIEPVAESYRLSLPGKLFEYIHNGLPVLGSPLPEIAAHIERYRIGTVGRDFSTGAFLKALHQVIEGSRQGLYDDALRQAASELCWEREQEHWWEALRHAL